MLSYSLILDLYVLFLIIQNQSLDDTLRALHNSYFLKEDGLFFSSEALGLVFSAPLHQSLQKSPPSSLGRQKLSGFAKLSFQCHIFFSFP